MTEPGATILGAVIALAGTIVVGIIQVSRDDAREMRRATNHASEVMAEEDRRRGILAQLIRLEIRTINTIIAQLNTETIQLQFIPLRRLNEINTAKTGFERNREWVVLFTDETLRQDLFNWYVELTTAVGDAWSAESAVSNVLPSQALPPWVPGERARLVQSFTEFANRGRDLIQRLERQ